MSDDHRSVLHICLPEGMTDVVRPVYPRPCRLCNDTYWVEFNYVPHPDGPTGMPCPTCDMRFWADDDAERRHWEVIGPTLTPDGEISSGVPGVDRAIRAAVARLRASWTDD